VFNRERRGQPPAPSVDYKLKHLEFVQAAIARMANNSFLFKGWAVTIASALAAFATVESKRTLLAIAIISTVLFWGMDGYYLWLERGFANLHTAISRKPAEEIDFSMAIDKSRAFCRWCRTCLRWHLLLYYGGIILVDIIGILFLKGGR
jgi:hypothetical protein